MIFPWKIPPNKKLYIHSETNCLEKKKKTRTGLFMLSQKIETDKVDHQKAHVKFCSRKIILSIYLNFSRLVIFSLKIYRTISAFRYWHQFLQQIQAVFCTICNSFLICLGLVVWCSINIEHFSKEDAWLLIGYIGT